APAPALPSPRRGGFLFQQFTPRASTNHILPWGNGHDLGHTGSSERARPGGARGLKTGGWPRGTEGRKTPPTRAVATHAADPSVCFPGSAHARPLPISQHRRTFLP